MEAEPTLRGVRSSRQHRPKSALRVPRALKYCASRTPPGHVHTRPCPCTSVPTQHRSKQSTSSISRPPSTAASACGPARPCSLRLAPQHTRAFGPFGPPAEGPALWVGPYDESTHVNPAPPHSHTSSAGPPACRNGRFTPTIKRCALTRRVQRSWGAAHACMLHGTMECGRAVCSHVAPAVQIRPL